MPRRLVVLGLAGACLVSLAACGGVEVTQPTRTLPPPTTTTIATTTTVPVNYTCTPETPAVPADGKPTVAKPETVTELKKNDIKVGDGAEAKPGDKVKMQYVGVSGTNGEEFDSSWSRNNEPFEFTIGQGMVIKGWDEGVPGMKVGGRRELIIPPALGYGEAGSPPKIAANDTLAFVVDLVQVCNPVPVETTVPGTDVPGSSVPASTPDGATSTTVAGSPTGSTPGSTP